MLSGNKIICCNSYESGKYYFRLVSWLVQVHGTSGGATPGLCFRILHEIQIRHETDTKRDKATCTNNFLIIISTLYALHQVMRPQPIKM